MNETEVIEVNWIAVFFGFVADWAFTEFIGVLVMILGLKLQSVILLEGDPLPPDVLLAMQIVGVIGALLGGILAGWLARQRGVIHGVLVSILGLTLFVCTIFVDGHEPTLGNLGFVILNLVAAGYGGGLGVRLRARTQSVE